MAFVRMPVTFDMHVVISCVQKLSFGRPCASTSGTWRQFCSSGTRWGFMKTAGRVRGGPEPDDGKHSLE